jgi:hypothetical protein
MPCQRSLGAGVVVLLSALAPCAAAAPTTPPTWSNIPALLASATAPVAEQLRRCVGKRLPCKVSVLAMRARDGATAVRWPLPATLGGRGMTPEERCLAKTIPLIKLPPLPADVARVGLLHVITAADAPPPPRDPAFDAWRDLRASLAAQLTPTRRTALAGCDRRPRTVRVMLDLRRGATRVWLPAWQFHSPQHDGTTPPAEQRVKACLGKVIRDWRPPPLPRAMAELELAVPVKP